MTGLERDPQPRRKAGVNFHATAACAILRHAGLPIGKRDFMGAV